jgi:hypothetical protein
MELTNVQFWLSQPNFFIGKQIIFFYMFWLLYQIYQQAKPQ